MNQTEKEIAEKKEILRFYTGIMRGEDENATVANRLSAAEKLTAQLDADSSTKSAVEKLDCILNEFRRAVAEGGFIAKEGDECAADDEAPFVMPVELPAESEDEDDDEDQP